MIENLKQNWQLQIDFDCPEQSVATRKSILLWLFVGDKQFFDTLNSSQIEIVKQAIADRYNILRQRYLGVPSQQAYCHLIKRLGSLVMVRNKIRNWVTFSPNRNTIVLDVLQEVVQDLLQSDPYMQHQMSRIATCTNDLKLRNALLFANLEEYCLQPICNQPLLVYRLVNYLYRTSQESLVQASTSASITQLSFFCHFSKSKIGTEPL